MKNQPTSLIIIVLTAIGVQHYVKVKHGICLQQIQGYFNLLQNHGYLYKFSFDKPQSTLVIYEPRIKPSKIKAFNSQMMIALDITELDNAAPEALPGDPLFWNALSKEDITFVKLLFTKMSNKSLMEHYGYNNVKSIETKIRELLAVIRIKYPTVKMANRNDLREFAIRIGVYIPQCCPECGRVK